VQQNRGYFTLRGYSWLLSRVAISAWLFVAIFEFCVAIRGYFCVAIYLGDSRTWLFPGAQNHQISMKS